MKWTKEQIDIQGDAAECRREEPKTYIDVTSEEVRCQETEDLNFKPDLLGQAITATVIALGALVLVYNLVRWLCGF